MADPEKVTARDVGLVTLEAGLRAWARETDLYLPRIPELAQSLYDGPVTAILTDALHQAATQSVERLLADDPSCGNSRHCPEPAEHDTHIWDWYPSDIDQPIAVRCPGRDGI